MCLMISHFATQLADKCNTLFITLTKNTQQKITKLTIVIPATWENI